MAGPIKLRAAAGGKGGSWYVLLEGLAKLVNQVHPEIEIEVVEGGGIGNHSGVGSGDLDMAILNPPMTVAALKGTHPFQQPWLDLRIGIANLTLNHLHFVVEAALPLNSLEDWFGQKYPLKIPVDRTSTVDRLVFQMALDHFGVAESDLETWGGGAIPAMNYDKQLELYQSGQVNALWQFMGIPSPSILEAHHSRLLKVLPLPSGLIDELVERGWEAAEIPAGAYGIVRDPIPTVSMGTSLGFNAGVPDDVVCSIINAICGHPKLVREIHPAALSFDPARACCNAGGPLHAGAKLYYQSKGLPIEN